MAAPRRLLRPLLSSHGLICWYLAVNKIISLFFLFYLSPGRYQQLDLFIKVLRLLCPNLTDAKSFPFLFDLEFVC
jgi:hypothetical protein